MTKNFKLMLVVALAISVAGCFDYAERLELNADGSGIINQHMVLYKEGLQGMMQRFLNVTVILKPSRGARMECRP